jgi:hypothetical protein
MTITRARLASLILVATGVAVAACAPTDAVAPTPGQGSGQVCFFPRQVTNFRFADADTVYVRSSRRDVYRLTTTGCLDGEASLSIALLPGGGGSRLCPGDRVDIVLSSNTIGQNPCRARVEDRLTEAEVEALPDRDRP